jgi:hypothetical protein
VFLIAAQAIQSSSEAGFQYDRMAVKEVVTLIERVLADHRDLFDSKDKSNTGCLEALLSVLDLFVEAGWPDARRLTNRLEEIYH